MARTVRGGESCAIARTVDVLRDPWTFLVLREAFGGVTRFGDFRSALGIASDVLTERLHALVDAGVLSPGITHSYAVPAADQSLFARAA